MKKQIFVVIILSLISQTAYALIFNPIDPVADKCWQNRDNVVSVTNAIEIYEDLKIGSHLGDVVHVAGESIKPIAVVVHYPSYG